VHMCIALAIWLI